MSNKIIGFNVDEKHIKEIDEAINHIIGLKLLNDSEKCTKGKALFILAKNYNDKKSDNHST